MDTEINELHEFARHTRETKIAELQKKEARDKVLTRLREEMTEIRSLMSELSIHKANILV